MGSGSETSGVLLQGACGGLGLWGKLGKKMASLDLLGRFWEGFG